MTLVGAHTSRPSCCIVARAFDAVAVIGLLSMIAAFALVDARSDAAAVMDRWQPLSNLTAAEAPRLCRARLEAFLRASLALLCPDRWSCGAANRQRDGRD